MDLSLDLWDNPSTEGYDRLRPLSYPGTNVFMICFAINNRSSFERVTEKWVPEITTPWLGKQHDWVGKPFILVGTKTDLRDEHGQVTLDEGKAKAMELGAFDYVECSAYDDIGVSEVFQQAVRAVLSSNMKSASNSASKQAKRCIIM